MTYHAHPASARALSGPVARSIEILGPVVVVAIAWASTNVRDTMSIVNVALVTAAVSIAVAIVGWRGGLATSLAAALALNYFHTEPVHSLRITSTNDLIAVLLLGSLGAAVSIGTAMRIRVFARSDTKASQTLASANLAESLRQPQPLADVWMRSVDASSGSLALVDCCVDLGEHTRLPLIARTAPGASVSSILLLPETGAAIPFANTALPGRLVLIPRPGIGAVEVDRRAVLACVDNVELALTAQPASRS